jgi:AcrR family transcriptional regulator
MGRKAQFTKNQFVDAALKLAAEQGPGAITMGSITGQINAPIGSVYHRFASREILLAELWLRLVESFQQGFLEALDQGDGLQAALHTLNWVRKHPNEGRVLLLYRREELTSGEWPDEIKERARQLTQELDKGLRKFTRRLFGRVTKKSLIRITFTLIDVPYAAVRRHLQAGRLPPVSVDELVRKTYLAILGRYL